MGQGLLLYANEKLAVTWAIGYATHAPASTANTSRNTTRLLLLHVAILLRIHIAFRHYFAYFLFFFKAVANCFCSEHQRSNAIVIAIWP
jgi:hypothetical protein